MSNCMTCFGRGTVIGSDGKPKACPSCSGGFTPTDPDAAFAAAWSAYVPMVRRLAVARLREKDVQLAEDIAQEAFLRFWRYLSTGHRVTSPAALLNRITSNVVVEHYRLARHTRENAADLTDWTWTQRMPSAPAAEDDALAELAALDRLCAHLQAVTA